MQGVGWAGPARIRPPGTPRPGRDHPPVLGVSDHEHAPGSAKTPGPCFPGRPCSGMKDLLEIMQSETMLLQLAYGALEILVVHLMPELKSLFTDIKHGSTPL